MSMTCPACGEDCDERDLCVVRVCLCQASDMRHMSDGENVNTCICVHRRQRVAVDVYVMENQKVTVSESECQTVRKSKKRRRRRIIFRTSPFSLSFPFYSCFAFHSRIRFVLDKFGRTTYGVISHGGPACVHTEVGQPCVRERM